MPFQIKNANITTMFVDAIVNPTDRNYSGSGGVDYQIHHAAGNELRAECDKLAKLQTGSVAVTQGYNLPCQYVFHTVGPIWKGGSFSETTLLRSCYLNALLQAKKLGVSSIAFPLISSGTFGFPKDQVLKIAIDAFRDFEESISDDMEITLCVFDRKAYDLSCKDDLEQFLSKNIIPTFPRESAVLSSKMSAPSNAAPRAAFSEECECTRLPCREPEQDLDSWLKKQDDSFAVALLKLIDKKGMTEVQCYKKAQVTKNTFWEINNNPNYRPSKQTAIAFAIALELTLEETQQFLKTVGITLSHSNTFDMIIEYYITNGIYDIYEINAALYRYDQVCLGC